MLFKCYQHYDYQNFGERTDNQQEVFFKRFLALKICFFVGVMTSRTTRSGINIWYAIIVVMEVVVVVEVIFKG